MTLSPLKYKNLSIKKNFNAWLAVTVLLVCIFILLGVVLSLYLYNFQVHYFAVTCKYNYTLH